MKKRWLKKDHKSNEVKELHFFFSFRRVKFSAGYLKQTTFRLRVVIEFLSLGVQKKGRRRKEEFAKSSEDVSTATI